MELEGSQNCVGRETEWRWKRDGIAVEGSWELNSWAVDGVDTMRKLALAGACAISTHNSWAGYCCGCEGKC
eukprot:scaffold66476_cov39-Cyclotella_meneghiniana.AAC.1